MSYFALSVTVARTARNNDDFSVLVDLDPGNVNASFPHGLDRSAHITLLECARPTSHTAHYRRCGRWFQQQCGLNNFRIYAMNSQMPTAANGNQAHAQLVML
jgi:hypothetical protein